MDTYNILISIAAFCMLSLSIIYFQEAFRIVRKGYFSGFLWIGISVLFFASVLFIVLSILIDEKILGAVVLCLLFICVLIIISAFFKYPSNKAIIYEFIYDGNIYEGCANTISIHKTKKGAELALELHKERIKNEYNRLNDNKYGIDIDWRFGRSWSIKETELSD